MEIELKDFREYSPTEIEKISSYSSAVERYISILDNGIHPWKRERHHAWLNCAFATFFNTYSTREICHYWSKKSKLIVTQSFESHLNEDVSLIFMGKAASNELNLSSDIDLILVSTKHSENSLKLVRKWIQEMTNVNEEGFCYRFDFDLRPGGKQSDLIPSINQFRSYYSHYGQTWERMALARSEIHYDDNKIITQFVHSFVYRKHIDYRLKDEFRSLRESIFQMHKKIQNESIHLKLHPGGIRDIELFCYSLSIIFGGKNSEFQKYSVGQAFGILEKNNIITNKDKSFIEKHYWKLRHLEHLMQIRLDTQTHNLETNSLSDNESDATNLIEDLKGAESIISSLLPVNETPSPKYSIPQEFKSKVDELKKLNLLSRNPSRDKIEKEHFVDQFSKVVHENNFEMLNALTYLEKFIQKSRAKVSLFRFMNEHSKFIEQLAYVFSSSPYLSGIIIEKPEILDSFFLGKVDLGKSNDLGDLLNRLGELRHLSELINGIRFLTHRNLERLTVSMTESANIVLKNLAEYHLKSKNLNSDDLSIVGFGKLGTSDLGLRSDLDILFVCHSEKKQECQGVARRIIQNLSTGNQWGKIYSVDTRLHPSGHFGPLIVSDSQFYNYLENKAELWQRIAYLRGRSLNPNWLFDTSSMINRGFNEKERLEFQKIKSKLILSEKAPFNLKFSPGSLFDIETAVASFLIERRDDSTPHHLNNLFKTESFKNLIQSNTLQKNYFFLRKIEQLFHLLTMNSSNQLDTESKAFNHVAKLLKFSSDELKGQILEKTHENRIILAELDPTPTINT